MAQDYVNVSIPDTVALGNHVENTFFLNSDQVQLFDDETYRILVQAVDYGGSYLSIDTAQFSGWISLVSPVAQLVSASDRHSEHPGSNPGWISRSFFTIK